MGAMTAAALRFDPEVAARAAATSCAESTMARDMCAQSKMPQLIRVNIAGAIQASLLYAATTWPSLSVPQKKSSLYGITTSYERLSMARGPRHGNNDLWAGVRFLCCPSGHRLRWRQHACVFLHLGQCPCCADRSFAGRRG